MVQPLWRTVWRFPKKLKLELRSDPAILFLGIYPEKYMVQKDACTPVLLQHCLQQAKTWKQPEWTSTEEYTRMWYIYPVE